MSVEQAKQHFYAALDFIDASDFPNAELKLRDALSFLPGSASVLTNLAVVLLRQDKQCEARGIAEQAAAASPDNVEALLVLADCHTRDNESADALALLDRVITLQPAIADAHNNRGSVLRKLGHFDEALQSLDRAIALEPRMADAHGNRGNVLRNLKRHSQALAAYDKALALKPSFVEAWLGRGNVSLEMLCPDDALAAFEKALTLNPGHTEAWIGCGNVLSAQLRFDEARAAYQRALTQNPDSSDALQALALLLLSEGQVAGAFALARRALAIAETPPIKLLVAACLRSPLMHSGMADAGYLRGLLLRALTEPWGRQSEFTPACTAFLTLNPAIRDGMARAAEAWPRILPAVDLLSPASLSEVAHDELFRALLQSAPVCTLGLERFVTTLRFNLLAAVRSGDAVTEPELALYCALARQCFIGNYVFAQSDAESEQVRSLRDELVRALSSSNAIPALLLATVAAYVPLHTLPNAGTLLDRPWPEPVGALLTQQVAAPLEEQRIAAAIPALTPIGDGVTAEVPQQYEENPYPQWVKAAPAAAPKTVDAFIRERFPRAPFVELGKSGDVEIMVAGCGTGQHSIDTASRFKAAPVLAVDLSLASLSYAQRQTRALGLNIRFAQADIMKLGTIGRTFDVIEAGGVLHHLADPFAGWRVLLSLLRPHGIMLLGLYSEAARRDVVAAREFIAERGHGSTAADIRRCRQELFNQPDGSRLKDVTLNTDFFSVSECRDLLFHVQEHHLTVPQIASFIEANGLQFLGFELDPQTQRNYARQFPGDTAMTDLAQWHRYETENPRALAGMYQFWMQKK
ncbi:MAG: tetratricopeptide repeat protein [Hyphomicrobiales bacterium]